MIVVVMGVSGVGKTTIGKALARELGWRFIDADQYHPPENVAKMAAGIALDDTDRRPWLETLNRIVRKEKNAVLACSALKEAYRSRITDGLDRKSTRLNSSHLVISYAVFCLKKKKKHKWT